MVAGGETEKLEFKRSLAEKEEILRTIVAFSNVSGGTILVGVSEEGEVIGLTLNKGDLEDLENSINQLIEPKVYPELQLVPYNNKLILKANVNEGFNKPYLYKGACYVRRGNVTRRLDRDGVVGLLTRKATFDSIIFEGEFKPDMDLIEEFLRRAKDRRRMKIESSSPGSVLRKMGLIHEGKTRNGAALLFSWDCSSYFPQAIIKIGYFEGEKVLDETLIEGPLQVQVEKATDFIKGCMRKGYTIKGLERIENWEYPLDVVREVLVNAVLHRDYFSYSPVTVKIGEFGIIVENPGELPPPLKIEDLQREHPSIPRNPLISRAFYYMGYFEEWGSGTLRIIKSLREAGLPDPEFIQEKGYFRVWIRSLRSLERYLNENEKKLLDFIRARRSVSRKDCELFLNLSDRSIRRTLSKLEQLGLTRKVEKGKRTRYESTAL